MPCFLVREPPALISARVVWDCHANLAMISSSVAPPARFNISMSLAVLLVSRGAFRAGFAALAFFATFGVLVAFSAFALTLDARFAFGADVAASVASWSAVGPPSFYNSAKIRLAAVAPSLNFLTGVTPVRLFQISTAVAAGNFFR